MKFVEWMNNELRTNDGKWMIVYNRIRDLILEGKNPQEVIEFIDTNFRAVGVATDIDEQISKDSIHQPWRWRVPGVGNRNLGKSQFKFIERIMPGFIDPWSLTGWSDEETRKNIRKRRMPLPIGNQAT